VGRGARPTLFGDEPSDHPLAQQEIFGPVQALIVFDSEAQAPRFANGTALGLVTGVELPFGGGKHPASAVK